MQLKPGNKVANLSLMSIDGSAFELESLRGKRFMLSFFRFAACPFCNMRMHELVTRHSELGCDFPIVADENNVYYREYGIEYSILGAIGRMPSLLNAIFVKGYLPTSIKGRLTTMPADFLVDETGVIQIAYYGKDEGDHLAFERVKAFAPSEKASSKE